MAAFMTFISLSSAPNIALGMQLMLIAWDRTLKIFAYRWYVLVITVCLDARVHPARVTRTGSSAS